MRSVIAACAVFAGILAAQTSAPIRIESWVTTPDRSSLFRKQTNRIEFHDGNRAGGRAIVIDETAQMQSMDGFGFVLTGANAEHLIKMSKQARALSIASSELQR